MIYMYYMYVLNTAFMQCPIFLARSDFGQTATIVHGYIIFLNLISPQVNRTINGVYNHIGNAIFTKTTILQSERMQMEYSIDLLSNPPVFFISEPIKYWIRPSLTQQDLIAK